MPKPRTIGLLCVVVLCACGFPGAASRSRSAVSPTPSPVSTQIPPVKAGPPPVAVRPGVYQFEVKTRSAQSGETISFKENEVLEAQEVEPAVLRQRTYYRINGKVSYFTEALHTSSGTYAISQWLDRGMCFFGPPLQSWPHPILVGDTWSGNSFCANDSLPRRQLITRREVSGMEKVVIQGREIDAFVMDYRTELRQPAQQNLFNEGRVWYSEADKLSVRSTVKIGGGGATVQEREEILISFP